MRAPLSSVRRHLLRPSTLAVAAMAALASAPASAASCTWNTTSGNWNALANWLNCVTGNGSPAGVPGAADSATIGATGVVAVTSTQAINALSNAGVIDINAGSLRLNAAGGGTVNSGTINVNGGFLQFDSRSFAHVISGGGTIVLSGGGLFMEGGNSTTLGAGNTIRGAGGMGAAIAQSGAMNFINDGTISADTAGSLSLGAPANSGSYTNNNLMEARNGGTLAVTANIAQASGGVLQALNGSTVRLNNVTVSGGTLSTSGTGSIQATNTSNNRISNVTLAGVVDMTSVSQLRVANNLALNSGSILVGAGSSLYIDNRDNNGAAANQALSGSGAITLSGGNLRLETNAPATTTLGAGVSINGFGAVGPAALQGGTHTVVNAGTISANVASTALALSAPSNNGSYSNQAVMEARNGGTLQINSASIAQTGGGTLQALNGSTVVINNSSISGGTLTTSGTGVIRPSNTSNNVLSNVTLAGVVDMTSPGGSQMRVANNLAFGSGGLINVGGGSLILDNRDNQGASATQALSGTGGITVAGGTLRFEANNPAQTTVGANVSISGFGSVGAAALQAGSYTLVNNGLISANSSGNTLVLQPISNSGVPVQNNGVLEATGGGTLRLDTSVAGGTVSQLRAGAGSSIVINNVTVSGAVNTTGSGTVTASNTSNNLLRNVSLNGVVDLSPAPAQLRVANGLVLSPGSSIVVGGNSLYFDVRDSAGLATAQTISGGGSITVAGGLIRFETNTPGSTTLAAGTSITGHGTLGGAGLQGGNHSFVNAGTVSANVNGQTLVVTTPSNTGSFNNQATLEARNGGTLQFNGMTLSQTASGTTQALNGSTVVVNSSTISGGTLSSSGTGAIRPTNTSNNLFSGVTLAGVVDLAGGQVRIANGLTFGAGGVINVANSPLYLDNRDSQGLAANQALTGTGTINLAGGIIRMEANNPAQTTIGSGVTIAGFGSIGQAGIQSGTYAVVNNGTISANTAGQTLTLQPFANGNGTLTGTGRLQAAGGTLTMNLPGASTQGVLDIGSSGTFAMGAQNLTLNTDYTNVQAGSGNSFNRRAGVTGAGQILAGGNAAMNFTGAQITGGATGNATLTIGNVRVGTTTFDYQLANVGSSGPTLRGAIQTSVNGGSLTDTRLSGTGVTAGNFSTGAPGSNSGNLGSPSPRPRPGRWRHSAARC